MSTSTSAQVVRALEASPPDSASAVARGRAEAEAMLRESGTPVLPAKPPAPAAAERGSVIPHDRMYYLTPGDGSVWARGERYKVGFTAEGTQYVPFLGSEAPRNYPVTFRVEHVAVAGAALTFDPTARPTREGDHVRFERGSFVEAYELAPESMEQLFVFQALPARGELVVRLSTESELSPRALSGDSHAQGAEMEGLEFANELGAVRYGRATALDAAGRSTPAGTTLTGTGIEIRVPAEFVAAARFPLTIDPLVSTFSVDTSTRDDYLPDVAYDEVNQRWLVTYEEVWSATDHDIPYQLFGPTGSFAGGGYADFTSVYWANPACANNRWAQQFLIVAEVGSPSSGVRAIFGNAVSAIDGGVGLQIPISTADQGGDRFNADVGGNPSPTGPTYYGVVWERGLTQFDHDIHGRLVHPDGSLVGTGTILIDNSPASVDGEPSVSKSNDSIMWNLAWRRVHSSTHSSILGGRIWWTGLVQAASFGIADPGAVLGPPSASSSLSGTSWWVVAYEREWAPDFDIEVAFLEGTGILDSANLTSLESLAGAGNLYQDQRHCDVDADGSSFAVAYMESYNFSQTDYDVYSATLAPLGTQIALAEPHVNLAFDTTYEGDPAIASCKGSGGAPRRCMAVWRDLVAPSHNDIEAALYDGALYTSFCHPTWDFGVGCPCNNPPGNYGRGCNNSANTGGARLAASGLSYLSADTMVLTSADERPTALTIFMQGTQVLSTGVTYGQGARCAGGSLKRLFVKTASGGIASAPQSGDPSIHARSAALGNVIGPGETRAYFAYYRDPVVLGGCPGSSTFNASQAVQAIWLP